MAKFSTHAMFCLIPVALLMFASGFFPYKSFLQGHASFGAEQEEFAQHAPFDKIIFMVVDALRRLLDPSSASTEIMLISTATSYIPALQALNSLNSGFLSLDKLSELSNRAIDWSDLVQLCRSQPTQMLQPLLCPALRP